MAVNITQETINALFEMVSECFKMNRWLDRFVSVLGVKFSCNNSASKIHPSMAHFFPNFSDKIGELCLERYNISVEYGATPEGKEDYETATEMFQGMENKIINFQDMLIGAMKISFINDDLQVYSELSKLMMEYSPLVEQSILLNDKIKMYGEDKLPMFDSNIDKFWIL